MVWDSRESGLGIKSQSGDREFKKKPSLSGRLILGTTAFLILCADPCQN